MKLKPGGNLNFGLCEGFCVVFKAPKWRGGGSKKTTKNPHFFSLLPLVLKLISSKTAWHMAPWTKSDRIWHPTSMRFKVQNWGGGKKKKKGQKTLPPVASYSLLNFLLFPHIHSTSFITPTASSPLCLKGLIVRSLAGTTKRLIGFSLLKHSTVCLRRRQPLAVWAYISH